MEWIRNKLKNWSGKSDRPEDLTRSQYSLVSNTDVTAGALQLWVGLPDEVKFDSSLDHFKQLYEKEHDLKSKAASDVDQSGLATQSDLPTTSKAADQIPLTVRSNGAVSAKRLPSVASAPHLNNNIQTVLKEDLAILNGNKTQIKEEKEKIIDKKPSEKKEKLIKIGHKIKICLLVICWIVFTVFFLVFNEKEEVTRQSSLAPGTVKNYTLGINRDTLSVSLNLKGPFEGEQQERALSHSERAKRGVMRIWLERWYFEKKGQTGDPDLVQLSEPWDIVLLPENEIDFSEGKERTKVLRLNSDNTYSNYKHSDYAISMNTTSKVTLPFTLEYLEDPVSLKTGIIYSCILLGVLYVLIIFDLINRTMAAVMVSTSALATLAMVGERPSLEELISWLDVETLLLLFSMMVLVAIMAETGVFDFLAIFTFQITKGKIWQLIMLLSAITAVVSTVLDNVTTVLLMTPVTIRLCEVVDLDPIPVLMSMVLFSNIGGTATPVGDPPNVIIASNKVVIQGGINFANFTLHMTLGILLVSIQSYFQFRCMFRDTARLRSCEPREIQDLRHQITVWRRAADSVPPVSGDQVVVREKLDKKVGKLSTRLDALLLETKLRACPKENFETMLKDMKAKYKIKDKSLLIKCTIVITFVVILFFLHSIPAFNKISLGWTALLGAILLLILADRADLEPILHRVEWTTLLFFAALFILMEALSKLGLIQFIGGLTEKVILQVDEGGRLAVALLLIVWVSGLASAFVDNIPLTTMMIRIITSLGTNPTVNLPLSPLVWALSFGACLGGNGTLIGASANVVCAGVAEQHGYRFTFMQFFKIGFPIMIGHLFVASGYLLLCHCVFQWH